MARPRAAPRRRALCRPACRAPHAGDGGERRPADAHDIGQARITLHAPLFVDAYDAVRATGALTVIDEATEQAVGAGLVR
jgi:hypothetical protein